MFLYLFLCTWLLPFGRPNNEFNNFGLYRFVLSSLNMARPKFKPAYNGHFGFNFMDYIVFVAVLICGFSFFAWILYHAPSSMLRAWMSETSRGKKETNDSSMCIRAEYLWSNTKQNKEEEKERVQNTQSPKRNKSTIH